MSDSVEYRTLDPDEGPTAWIKQDQSNPYTYTLLFGSDPEDPTTSVIVSKQEIERAASFVDETHDD